MLAGSPRNENRRLVRVFLRDVFPSLDHSNLILSSKCVGDSACTMHAKDNACTTTSPYGKVFNKRLKVEFRFNQARAKKARTTGI